MKDTPVVSQDLVVGESEVRCPKSSPVTDISDESVIHHSRCTRYLVHVSSHFQMCQTMRSWDIGHQDVLTLQICIRDAGWAWLGGGGVGL